MLDSRASYGYGRGNGVTDAKTLKKWQVCYRSKNGYGEIGYKLFNTRDEAIAWGEAELNGRLGWSVEISAKHPSAIYSNY